MSTDRDPKPLPDKASRSRNVPRRSRSPPSQPNPSTTKSIFRLANTRPFPSRNHESSSFARQQAAEYAALHPGPVFSRARQTPANIRPDPDHQHTTTLATTDKSGTTLTNTLKGITFDSNTTTNRKRSTADDCKPPTRSAVPNPHLGDPCYTTTVLNIHPNDTPGPDSEPSARGDSTAPDTSPKIASPARLAAGSKVIDGIECNIARSDPISGPSTLATELGLRVMTSDVVPTTETSDVAPKAETSSVVSTADIGKFYYLSQNPINTSKVRASFLLTFNLS